MTAADCTVAEHKIADTEDGFIVIKVVTPLSRPKSATMAILGDFFSFECSPYFMKMKLPCKVSDNYKEVIQSFDEETNTYTVKLRKLRPGEVNTEHVDIDEIDECEELLKMNVKDDETSVPNPAKQSYGFCNMYSKMFGEFFDEFSDIIDLQNPDRIYVEDRTQLRMEDERKKWSDDHYLADTMETEHIKPLFVFKPPWIKSPAGNLTNDEQQAFGELPQKKWFDEGLSTEMTRQSELQMVDILFGYVYNMRTTEGENTVESAWTIHKLSCTLSWFEIPKDLHSVICNSYRRCLTYPLFRNWELVEMLQKDIVQILQNGTNQVTRCFLEIRDTFEESEGCYLLNTLFINDFCRFVSGISSERLKEISKEVENVKITKHEVNADLPLLEIAARLVLDEENENGMTVEEVIDRIGSMNIKSPTEGSESSEDSSGDFSDSSSSSSSSSSFSSSSESDADSDSSLGESNKNQSISS